MRRPMILIATAFGGGITAAFFSHGEKILWLGILTEAAMLLILGRKAVKDRNVLVKACVFLCVFSVAGWWTQYWLDRPDPIEQQVGKQIQIEGVVTDIAQKDRGYAMTVKTRGSRVLVRYYGKLEDYRQLAGCRVMFGGIPELPQARRNPGCFDYRLYLQTCGIRTVMTASFLEPAGGKQAAYIKFTARIKGRFERKLEACVKPEIKAMAMAMIFGDRSALPEDMYEDFQKNGTAHILAVSGLHIGIVYGFLAFLWRGKKGMLFYLGILFFLLAYAALADFSPSVVRAGLMITIHLGAKILHRRYDLLSAAAFTFLLMLCANPLQLFHIGFQLSFLAIASLGVILPFIGRWYQGIFLSSLAIQAGMLPYTAYVFNYVSLGAFFVNVPVIFLAGVLLPVGIGMLIVSCVSDTIFGMGAVFLEQGCRMLIWINSLFYAGGKTSFDVTSPPVFLLSLYYGLLFLGVCEKGRILFIRKKAKTLAAGALTVVLLSGIMAAAADDGFSGAEMVFVDVGQGDCVHVRTAEGRNYLFDGGGSISYDVGKKILKPYLLKNGVRKVDAAFATHLHEDHYGGIRSLAKEGMIEKIGVYEGNRIKEGELVKETGTEFLYLHGGQSVKLGEGVFLDILAPQRASEEEYEKIAAEEEDENAASLIMKLRYGPVSLLITGDIDQQGERALMEDYAGRDTLRSEILKVAHHGSKYSSTEDFLEAVSPKMAVIQVGKNNFGHPSQAVIEKCREKDIMVYRNDTSGAIGICMGKGGRGISVQKMME
ncbi:DNA internalization-related competence protein ComEC/Rec2 [Anaerovorax odorimutans]|uniref:DNA internalization-related competence protein ComEC/Rec2 n=1 Tax=Anaerovorax odorimutans TaxID=109327 RepID=A0ABT1RRV7_9FIRM|nr:DNA internalization-related competence protein ComEC/Rec2 [Anaerovorax odorimutans]MCQ4637935.1 DNA internalization-related competence protein ComEC/Rec2 [Anaerovorax odorimutans]